MHTERLAMGEDDDNVSPYLRQRLRSYAEALRDRLRKRRRERRNGDDTPSGRRPDNEMPPTDEA